VLCKADFSASGSHMGVVVKRENFESLRGVVFVTTKTN